MLSAPLTEIREIREQLAEQVDGLGDATDLWSAVGFATIRLEQDGFYNESVGGLHEALEAADPQVLLYAPVGNVIGRDFVGLSAVRTIYDRLPAKGVHHRARAIYLPTEGAEPLGSSFISADLVARTAVGPVVTTTVDSGAATTAGGAVYLGVSALNLDGGTNVTIEIRHSTDNFGANDVVLATFTAVTVAPFAQRIAIVGTINRYTRTRYLFNGAAGAARTITFATGIGRK